jgi:hypothetical protein
MPLRTRKLIGTVALLGFLAAYVTLVGAVALGRVAEGDPLLLVAYALVAGLAWVLPAGLILRWMLRP